MQKILFLILVVQLQFIHVGVAQMMKSKDGVALGERSDFISACTKGAKKSLMNIKGVEVQSSKYCSCVCDNLIPNVYSWELTNAMKENKLNDFIMNDKNYAIIMQCLEGNYEIKDDYEFNQKMGNTELQKKIAVKTCVDEMMQSAETKGLVTKPMAEQYCSCAIDKLLSSGYTMKDLKALDDENSAIFNEIAVPCLVEALAVEESKEGKSNKVSDIIGGTSSCSVPLINYLNKGYKIKLSIGGVSKYFLFDTGASDLIIDRETERELLMNGVLKKESYLNKTTYEMANNTRVAGQKVKVNGVTLGDYTINNVVMGVIDEGSLLCGKSFLDKFKHWEIDKTNNLLILYK